MRKQIKPKIGSVLEFPKWEHWRQRAYCRLWQAAMLTLNLNPTVKNRSVLAQLMPERYQLYRSRLDILTTQYSKHPLLPETPHPRTGDSLSTRYSDVDAVLAFAKEKNWNDMQPMEVGLSQAEALSTSGNRVYVEDDGHLAKGEQYTRLRMGALLRIIEKCLQPANAKMREKLLRGTGLSMSALGEEMEKEIAEAAQLKNVKTVSRFTARTNRKSLADAERELASFF